MKREEVLAICRKAPDVGKVKHEDFVDYVVVLETPRRIEGDWVMVETAYMAVDGKLAMANMDHRLQGKRLDFEDPIVLVDNEEQLTLMVIINSEIYGRRHGIATSRKVGGTATEEAFPWEVAETSAIGRALSAMGYGLLPGAGLASADDMLRVAAYEKEAARRPRSVVKPPVASQRRPRQSSAFQRRKLVEMYSEVYEVPEDKAQTALNEAFQQQFGHGLEEATYDEGVKMTAWLLRERKEKGKG
ncbi:MAG: hypothetical protein H5T64_06010 [Chloroflexi bacterium]|nr:hypothetical protein [Chloroflexota bacterium]